jgi:hypothetical protein
VIRDSGLVQQYGRVFGTFLVRFSGLPCGLELHPEKTKIVYCKDEDRRRTYPNEKFDFLGYTFRPRRSKNRKGKFFINFSPAVSDKAVKAIRAEIRSWNLHLRSDKSIEDLSMIFANGDTLAGKLFENDSAVLATNTGPFTQTLTFTGGTGEFAGASGSVSGGGVVGTTGFTASGGGTLTAAGVSVPEPASVALIFGGLLVMVASRKLVQQQR